MSKTEPAKDHHSKDWSLIEGLDLTRPLDDEQFEWLHQAWMDHLVLFLKARGLPPSNTSRSGSGLGNFTFILQPPLLLTTPR